MALLKLYRGLSTAAPAAEVGKIWFVSDKQVIKVYNGTEWEQYALTEEEIAALILAAKNEVLGTLEEGDSATLAALNDEIDALQAKLAALAAKTVTINEKTTGHVTVSKTVDENGATVYTVAENDIASAKGLADEIKRATDEEARIEGLVTAEAARAAKAEEALAGRLDVIEGEAEGSIKKALADAKAYTDAAKAAIEGTLADDDAKTLEAINDELDTLAARGYKVAEVTEGLPANIERRYQLVDQTGAVIEGSVNIDVEKESALKNVELVNADADGVAGNYLKWTYVLADGTEKVQYLNVSELLVEAEFKNGLEVSAAGKVSVKVDAASEAFLTVGEAGVKLAGVQDAINAAEAAAKKHTGDSIAALNAEVASTDGAKVTVKVTEVGGKITTVNVTESDIASAAALATLDAEVQEHEVVVSAALNDLNARVDGHKTRLDELEGALADKNVAAESTTPDYVTATAADNKVTVAATQKVIDAVALAETSVQTITSDNTCLKAVKTGNNVALSLVWEKGSF